MNVTILGATGAVGREITSQLIRTRALARQEILQLATNPLNPASRLCAEGIRRDLQDAYAEIAPELQVVERPGEFIGDIVVVAGGKTIDPDDFTSTRRDLQSKAKEFCDYYAAPLAESLTSQQVTPIFLVVTNPVEYVVQHFAYHLSRKLEDGARFVIGMGAHSDSLRFQWEIAHDLGVSRDRVSANVVGEHGPAMVPRWSTVQIRGMPEREQQRCLQRLYAKDKEAESADFDALLERRQKAVMGLLQDAKTQRGHPGSPVDVLKLIESYRPDFRVILKPLAVHRSNSGTAHATGMAASSLIHGILRGDPLVPSVQRMVCAPEDAGGPSLPFGVPTALSELLRFSGFTGDAPWNWRGRTFAPGTFRACRAADEDRRIDQAIRSLQSQSLQWQNDIAT